MPKIASQHITTTVSSEKEMNIFLDAAFREGRTFSDSVAVNWKNMCLISFLAPFADDGQRPRVCDTESLISARLNRMLLNVMNDSFISGTFWIGNYWTVFSFPILFVSIHAFLCSQACRNVRKYTNYSHQNDRSIHIHHFRYDTIPRHFYSSRWPMTSTGTKYCNQQTNSIAVGK